MKLSMGEKLNIRAMVYVAAEPIPYFWPMRSFIHHNPLHGLEDMPFETAVEQGRRLFHARGYLPRSEYQRYLKQGSVDYAALESGIGEFAAQHAVPSGIDLARWLLTLVTATGLEFSAVSRMSDAALVQAALGGTPMATDGAPVDVSQLSSRLRDQFPPDMPLCEVVDALYGTELSVELDERVIRVCLDFLDEGQSVWGMPERERGLFAAWRELSRHDMFRSPDGEWARQLLEANSDPEGVIAQAMAALGIPEKHWVGYFTRELARLHGWAGFIRWRSSASRYHWAERYPADLVDYLAVRLSLSLALLHQRRMQPVPRSLTEVYDAVNERSCETYLRHDFHSGAVMPELAHRVERVLALGRRKDIEALCGDYLAQRKARDSALLAQRLDQLARLVGDRELLRSLDDVQLQSLIDALVAFENSEGRIWLQAVESHAINRLLEGTTLAAEKVREKRPFVQSLFCIDTRSERIRRHLESVGDYQTYGIAGFFGVPVSFIELDKGSENHLSPVLLTPKNLVLEISANDSRDDIAVGALEKALHELKESVLTPFVTVEAIGLLFGFDMIGKTIAPQGYHRWRRRLHPNKPSTHLLLDKISREQADSIIRAVQRAVIVKAVEQELGLEPERITDDMIRELREAALGHVAEAPRILSLGLSGVEANALIDRLRSAYRINASYARLQFERLGRIGFSLDEQVGFVSQALRSIGLTRDFSRFILLVGHGSTSENNPYESALDCGACGGNHGLVSARVLAQMANKPRVREGLRGQGIIVPDDAWFVPALHNTTTDELTLVDLDLLPPSHLVYLDRLRNGLTAASRLCAQERMPTLQMGVARQDASQASRVALRNSMDWSQVRPEWGLSRNAYFIIGRRSRTENLSLDGRAFLHSYDYRLDPKRRLLENILAGPLVVAQWINMEHYFSTVDSECFGSGSKVYHNVAGRIGVMSGNISDLRTGLPTQTVLKQGRPYHEPLRLITMIESPFNHARRAIESVLSIRRLVRNGWIRMLVLDPETGEIHLFDNGDWRSLSHLQADVKPTTQDACIR